MTNLFVQIKETLDRLEGWGWCDESKACALAGLVIGLRPQITVEIGVWAGRSLLPLALAHKAIGQGMVVAIDCWKASESAKGQIRPEDENWWRNNDHEKAYQMFRHEVLMLGVQNLVSIQRNRSDDIVPPSQINLLHVDGNHGEQALRDVTRYAPNIVPGGILILDDLNWAGGGVRQAEDKALRMGFRRLYQEKDWATFQRTA